MIYWSTSVADGHCDLGLESTTIRFTGHPFVQLKEGYRPGGFRVEDKFSQAHKKAGRLNVLPLQNPEYWDHNSLLRFDVQLRNPLDP